MWSRLWPALCKNDLAQRRSTGAIERRLNFIERHGCLGGAGAHRLAGFSKAIGCAQRGKYPLAFIARLV